MIQPHRDVVGDIREQEDRWRCRSGSHCCFCRLGCFKLWYHEERENMLCWKRGKKEKVRETVKLYSVFNSFLWNWQETEWGKCKISHKGFFFCGSLGHSMNFATLSYVLSSYDAIDLICSILLTMEDRWRKEAKTENLRLVKFKTWENLIL